MTLRTTVGSLTTAALRTSYSAARHPLATTLRAAGVVKGTAGVGRDVVRALVGDQPPAPTSTTPSGPTPAADDASASPATSSPATPVTESSQKNGPSQKNRPSQGTKAPGPRSRAAARARADLPGPDTVAKPVPEIGELPEPVVIEAEPEQPAGETLWTEPKAATRDSEHGGPAGDREEVEGYLEEAEDAGFDVETPVGTTGAEVGTNPATAESDLQQPGTPPLDDPAVAAQVRSESETLRRGAERDPG